MGKSRVSKYEEVNKTLQNVRADIKKLAGKNPWTKVLQGRIEISVHIKSMSNTKKRELAEYLNTLHKYSPKNQSVNMQYEFSVNGNFYVLTLHYK